MLKRTERVAALLILASMLVAAVPRTPAQVRAVYDLGAGGLGLKLRRLPTIASAMHTAAHPDDEDSALIARLARGDNARVSYLSLTRGEGGQNVIGPELFESLGIIRSEELLQARRLDGGEQFFTRFMEYGFSKKREEAARIWGEKEVLGDMVRAIRLFRPLVVLSRFSGTPADGHGQHQLAGYLTPQAYKAAGDPTAYPEHFAEGLRPWKPLKLYMGQGMGGNSNVQATVTVQTGDHDPLLGRSYSEVAVEGRSQHKSQEMGSIEYRGRAQSGLRLLESEIRGDGAETDVFGGIDISIAGISKISGDDSPALRAKLSELQLIAEAAYGSFDPYAPQKLVPTLARGVKAADEAMAATTNPEAKFLLEKKRKDFVEALQHAAGIVIDALSDSETVVAGDAVGVTVKAYVSAASAVSVIGAEVRAESGWQVEKAGAPAAPANPGFRVRNEVSDFTDYFKLTAPAGAEPTQPYWLRDPRSSFTFNWMRAGGDRNMPFNAPLAVADVKVRIAGEEVTFSRRVEFRYADDIRGEIRRELSVVPLVTNTLESNLAIVPNRSAASMQRIVMSITNNAPRQISGTASLELPAGWKSTPSSAPFKLASRGEKTAVVFDVTVPGSAKDGSYSVVAKSVVDGKSYSQTVHEIAYPHIQTHRRYSASSVDFKVVDLAVADVRVGYIMGTGDRVPEAIKLLGLDVTMLNERDLTTGDLSRFDVIVVGIRASQVRRDFVANNGRLLDYVRSGGTMIVQYQQQEFIRENMLPFPARMDAVINGTQRLSNLRTVDENAPVKILAAGHPVLTYPNRIGASDFDNWVQERHLYSLSQLDKAWTPLLESHDEGEPEIPGGLVYARLGKGHYVYNSYSFFRQLPTGNPGAYRIFANLLSLPKTGNR